MVIPCVFLLYHTFHFFHGQAMSIFHNKKRVQHRRSNKPCPLSNVSGTINLDLEDFNKELEYFAFITIFAIIITGKHT